MRISDWSSDVCSSDLVAVPDHRAVGDLDVAALGPGLVQPVHAFGERLAGAEHGAIGLHDLLHLEPQRRSEERRVGKEWSVRVDLGGRRNIKKTNISETCATPVT